MIYTISIGILCVLWEGHSLLESNQEIYDFCKWLIFEKQRHFDLCKVNFCISKLFIQCNTSRCCVHVTGGVNITQSVGWKTVTEVGQNVKKEGEGGGGGEAKK